MVLRDVKLSATDSNWRLFMVRKADPAFLAFQEKIHARDDFTCQYCGFKSHTSLEVINKDGNYRNNRVDNLVTACGFCAQCFFLEAIGKGSFGGGVLIFLPEMTQGDLNALCHVLFASMVTGNSAAIESRNIYRSFKLRAQLVEKQLGEGLSNPALLGQLLVDASEKGNNKLHDALDKELRLLPDATHFAPLVREWVEAGLSELEVGGGDQ